MSYYESMKDYSQDGFGGELNKNFVKWFHQELENIKKNKIELDSKPNPIITPWRTK